MGKLLLLFIIVPLVDAWLLIQLGGMMGFANTLLLVIATGVLGAWLFRLEGTRAWGKWQSSLAEGRVPEEGVLGGVLLLVGGVLLVTPGVITDAVGLLLLVPPTRSLVARVLGPRLTRAVKNKARSVVESPNVRVVHFGFGGGPGPRPARREVHRREVDVPDVEVVGRRIATKSGGRSRPQVIDADFEIKPD